MAAITDTTDTTPVSDLLTGTVRTVHPSMSLRAAARAMAADGIGLLVVENSSGALAGVVSERDLVSALADDADLDGDRLDDVMAQDVVTVDATDTLAVATHRMVEADVRHLVVVDPTEGVVGVISARDVMRALAGRALAQTGATT